MYIDGLDVIDNKILSILKKNARASYSEIGERVGLSRVSVKNRIVALEEKGVIQGYVAQINPTAHLEGRRFFINVFTEPDQFEMVVDNFAKYEIIRRVFAVTGESRFIAEGYATSNMKYEMFTKNLKRHLEGVKSISIQDVQYVIKDSDGGVDYIEQNEGTKR